MPETIEQPQIDPADYLTLTKAAKITPGRPSTAAIWRWATRGIRVRDGSRIHLEHLRMGGQILTTRAWIIDFGRKLAEANEKHEAPTSAVKLPRKPTSKQRAKQIEDAAKRLSLS